MFRQAPIIAFVTLLTVLCGSGCISDSVQHNRDIQQLLQSYPPMGSATARLDASHRNGPSDAQSPPTHSSSEVALASYSAPSDLKDTVPLETLPTGTPVGPFSLKQEDGSGDWKSPNSRPLSLDQVIRIALTNSTVLRGLGARVIESPDQFKTIYGPPVSTTDPIAGIEAALSAFDAQFSSDFLFEDNRRILNNRILGLGVNDFTQTLYRSETSLSKRTASGTQFTLRNHILGDRNSSASNLARGRAWEWHIESEIRQPLLLGRGIEFNQIAGPNSPVGSYRGIKIARLNARVSVSEFQIALRDYLSNVENAYWDLYFAYQNLKVKTDARDRCLSILQELQAREATLRGKGGMIEQASEQYYQFEEQVQNALAGRLLVGTQTFNGSGGGTFQGVGGVYACERRLRMLVGEPINDGSLIQTTDRPDTPPMIFNWNDVVNSAHQKRIEIQVQSLKVEKKELEVIASREFKKPRLDAIGAYRYRGLGDNIYGSRVLSTDPDESTYTPTHEWWAGLSLSYPVGQRLAHSAMRNAQLELSREKAVLAEVERQIIYGISNAKSEYERTRKLSDLAEMRRQKALEQYEILSNPVIRASDEPQDNLLLDSQRRLAEAESNLLRSKIQEKLAIKNLYFEMGMLFESYNIQFEEGDQTLKSSKSDPRKERLKKRMATVANLEESFIASENNDSSPTIEEATVTLRPAPAEIVTEAVSEVGEIREETSFRELLQQQG